VTTKPIVARDAVDSRPAAFGAIEQNQCRHTVSRLVQNRHSFGLTGGLRERSDPAHLGAAPIPVKEEELPVFLIVLRVRILRGGLGAGIAGNQEERGPGRHQISDAESRSEAQAMQRVGRPRRGGKHIVRADFHDQGVPLEVGAAKPNVESSVAGRQTFDIDAPALQRLGEVRSEHRVGAEYLGQAGGLQRGRQWSARPAGGTVHLQAENAIAILLLLA